MQVNRLFRQKDNGNKEQQMIKKAKTKEEWIGERNLHISTWEFKADSELIASGLGPQKSASETDFFRKLYMLLDWDRSYRSNLLSQPVSMLTPDQPVLVLTLWRQASGRVATEVPVLRVPDQNDVSQAWCRVEICHSSWKASVCKSLTWFNREWQEVIPRSQYHGGRWPLSDDSIHCPTVIPPSALDKPSIMKRYHCQRTCNHTSPHRLPMMVTLHDTWFLNCWWWNDGWTVKTVVTWQSSDTMIPLWIGYVLAGRDWCTMLSFSRCCKQLAIQQWRLEARADRQLHVHQHTRHVTQPFGRQWPMAGKHGDWLQS